MRVAVVVSAIAVAACVGGRAPVAPPSGADSTRIVALEVSVLETVIEVGQTVGATATEIDQHGGRLRPAFITWSSASPTIATVSASGQVTGQSAGSTSITATLDTLTASATVVVAAPHPQATVTMSPTGATILRKSTLQLVAELRDTAGAVVTPQQVAWTSADLGIATVSNTGLVTALEEGTVTISVSLDGHTAYSRIRVTPLLSSIITILLLKPDTITQVNDSVQILGHCDPERPLTKVVGHIGSRTFTARSVPLGSRGAGEGWEAWVKVSDMPVGFYYAVMTVYDSAGATASDSVRFKRKPAEEGNGMGTSGFKVYVPPPDTTRKKPRP